MYKAIVTVTFKKSILDPQGNTVQKALKALGYQNVEEVRVGKHIEIKLDSPNRDKAKEDLQEMCKRLLANPVIEDYRVDSLEVIA